MTATDPAESTTQWRSPPVSRPESDLVGGLYQCNPAQAPLVVAPRLSWLTQGLGLAPGQQLGTLVGPEYDRVDLSVPTPHPLLLLGLFSATLFAACNWAIFPKPIPT